MTGLLRTLLKDAIPELPAPPDRLDSIARRVRRTRARWAAAGSALAVVVVVGLTTLIPGATPRPAAVVKPPADPCRFLVRHPDGSTIAMYGGNGPLVGMGSRWAALCVNRAPSGTLITRPDRLISVLNALPVVTKQNQHYGCSAVGLPNTDLVVGYPGGTTRTVELDFNCWAVRSGDGTVVRSNPRTAMNTFFDLYREQRAAAIAARPPGPVPCARQLTALELAASDRQRKDPVDEILRWDRSDLTPLPMRLAVANACRYVAGPGGLRLDRQAVARTGLERLRSAVNGSFTDSAAPRGPQGWPTCLDRPEQANTITRLDVLWLTDATGRSMELRIVRKPCSEVAGTGRSGFTPTTELQTALNQTLGGPP